MHTYTSYQTTHLYVCNIHLAYTQKLRKIKFNFHFRQKNPPKKARANRIDRRTNERKECEQSCVNERVRFYLSFAFEKRVTFKRFSCFFVLFISALKKVKMNKRIQNKHRKKYSSAELSIASIVEKKIVIIKVKRKKEFGHYKIKRKKTAAAKQQQQQQ